MGNMNETYTLPESVQGYINDKAISAGVDHLLSTLKKHPPADLTWDTLSDYHAATLAALTVKYDFAGCLADIFKAVWQPIIDDPARAGVFDVLNYSECWNWDLDFSSDALWNNGEWVQPYQYGKDGSVLWLGVYLDTVQGGLQASFNASNNDCQSIFDEQNGQQFPEWEFDKESEYWYSKQSLCKLDKGTIELSDLRKRALDPLMQELGSLLTV